MSIDPVRFGAAKYLKTSHAYYPVEARPDLAKSGESLIAAASATDEAGPVVGVQKTYEDAGAINFVVTERGLLLAAAGRFYPFAEMKSQEFSYRRQTDVSAHYSRNGGRRLVRTRCR